MDPAAIHDHHDLFIDFAERRHDLMHILASLLGIKVRHDFVEDFGGAILGRPNDTEQHPTGDTAPGAMASPRLAFAGLLAFDLTLAQRTCGEAGALGCAPPAGAGQGKTLQDRFIFIEQNDLAPASPGLQGSELKRAIGEISRSGIEPSGGTVVAYVLFLRRSGRSHGQAGPRCVGLTRWPVRGNSIANRGSHAARGLDQRGA
jgi:hypothetical protein